MTANTAAAGQGKINQRPFFRADHIGSLKRPHALLQARREHAAGSLDSKSLHGLEDDFIRTAVRRQEAAGLGVGQSHSGVGGIVTFFVKANAIDENIGAELNLFVSFDGNIRSIGVFLQHNLVGLTGVEPVFSP